MAAKKSEDLSEAVSHLLEECRMVLPGIQALFGFQLVAVFNQRFAQLSFFDQVLHLAAVAMVALSAGLVMTPAAFHREIEPHQVSEEFLRISTIVLLACMSLLAIGISTDYFIIGAMVFQTRVLPAMLSLLLLAVLVFLWFVFPFVARQNLR
jgi:hypothetical protein